MKPAAGNPRDPRRSARPAIVRELGSVKSVRVSQLCKLSECKKAAAVCYRLRHGAIEFLLVQTRRSRRWTFPKGSTEPGLSHAQAAAMEAFEEAGVHGRIEEVSFTRYVCRKPGAVKTSEVSSERGVAVSAHLCQVLRLSKPKESGRNRSWFSIQDTKRRLREGRKSGDADEFTRVVQRAVARIRQLSSEIESGFDRLRAESLGSLHFGKYASRPLRRLTVQWNRIRWLHTCVTGLSRCTVLPRLQAMLIVAKPCHVTSCRSSPRGS